MMTKTNKHAAVILTIGLLMAAATGCNDDAGNQAASSGTSPTPAATTGGDTGKATEAATQSATPAPDATTEGAPPTARVDPAPAESPAESPAPAPANAGPAPTGGGERQSVGEISWEIPQGWSSGGEKPMRLATLTDGKAEIVVSSFQGDLDRVGGLVPNVNRFRGQVKLPPVASEEEAEKAFTEIEVSGRKVRMLDLKGEESRNLVAIVPGDGRLYFFRMTDANELVDARKDAFDRVVQSVQVK